MISLPGGEQQGKLIVISAPSGSGKTTIAREIMRLNPTLKFSVSATTRPRRNGEKEGVDYFFLSHEEFRRRVDRGEFVEWEELFGNFYGTLKSELDSAIQGKRHLLFDVDVKGGLSIKREYPDALLIFIRTPDTNVLKQRLLARRTETPEMMQKRLDRVPMELEAGRAYTHQVVNDDLQKAVADTQRIVEAFLGS